jgi:N-acetyl-anhydromuramyl-L-alanine amidase AmpD
VVKISTARAEPNKLLNIGTVYWLMDENRSKSGLPQARFKENVRPPSNVVISAFRKGQIVPATFPITLRFVGGGKGTRPPVHAGAKQELEVDLDDLFFQLPSGDEEGPILLLIEPPADARSKGPAGPDTGDEDEERPGNCGSGPDEDFDGLFRSVRLAFDIVRIGDTLEIQNPSTADSLARNRGPHWNAVLHPSEQTGTRQRIMMDWKPDWIRRVRKSKKANRKPVPVARKGAELAMVVIHNSGGKRANAEKEGRLFPNGGSTVREFLNHATKGIHYVVDVDGHVTKLCHESFAGNHAGEGTQIPSWSHVGTRKAQIRAASVGIEHALFDREPEFYQALMTASVDLVKSLCEKHETIMPWNLVGHSDVVKKAACPGANFPWHRYESISITRRGGTLAGRTAPVALGADPNHEPDTSTMYNGFFDTTPSAVIGPKTKARDAIRELQNDLRAIGHSFHAKPSSGVYDSDTAHSVAEFHSRFMNGSAATPPDFSQPRITVVDQRSALQIKRVLHRLLSLTGGL